MSTRKLISDQSDPEMKVVRCITDLESLEDKARQLLRRCRYEEAALAFKEVASALQLQRRGDIVATAITSAVSSDVTNREIGAWEGLAVCLSRMLK